MKSLIYSNENNKILYPRDLSLGFYLNSYDDLQTNFQAGVDSVYNAVKAKGSTPSSKSLSDVVTAIGNINGGLTSFTYYAYAYGVAGGSSRAFVQNLQATNKLTFTKSTKLTVRCTAGSGWAANSQTLTSGNTLTFNGITELSFTRNYSATSGTSYSTTVTCVITIL